MRWCFDVGRLTALCLLAASFLALHSLTDAASAVASSPPSVLRTQVPSQWQPISPAPLTDSHSFILSLPQRNLDFLKARVAELSDPLHPDYQRWLSRAQLHALVSTPPAVEKAVLTWLLQAGISRSQITRHSDALEVRCSVAAVNRAFNTSLHVWQHPSRGRAVVALNDLTLPPTVAPHIHMLLGVHTFPFPVQHSAHVVLPHIAHAPSSPSSPTPSPSTASSAPLSPPTSEAPPDSPDFLYQYFILSARGLLAWFGMPDYTQLNRTAHPSSIITSVAVAEFDHGVNSTISYADLASQGKLGGVPGIQTSPHLASPLTQGGPQASPSYDLQLLASLNPSADVWYWEEGATVWVYGMCLHLQQVSNPPQVVSLSWYTSEQTADYSGLDGVSGYAAYMARSDTELMKLALLGVSVLAHSGSQGASGSGNSYCVYDAQSHPSLLYVEWPASSAYVTAVGVTGFSSFSTDTAENGTPLCGLTSSTIPAGYTASFATPWELYCFTQPVDSAVSISARSGGGFSRFIPQPSWQAPVVQAYLQSSVSFPSPNYYNASNRAIPDVSMYGGGSGIILSSTIHGYQGVSAPVMATLVSLLNAVSLNATNATLGYLNPLLYYLAANLSGAFKDITTGDNVNTLACVSSSTCGGATPCGCTTPGCTGFHATTGWDAVTGLGIPQYTAIATYLRSRAQPQPPSPASSTAATAVSASPTASSTTSTASSSSSPSSSARSPSISSSPPPSSASPPSLSSSPPPTSLPRSTSSPSYSTMPSPPSSSPSSSFPPPSSPYPSPSSLSYLSSSPSTALPFSSSSLSSSGSPSAVPSTAPTPPSPTPSDASSSSSGVGAAGSESSSGGGVDHSSSTADHPLLQWYVWLLVCVAVVLAAVALAALCVVRGHKPLPPQLIMSPLSDVQSQQQHSRNDSQRPSLAVPEAAMPLDQRNANVIELYHSH